MHVHRQLTAQQTQPSASISPSLPLDLFCGMLIVTALCQWANRLSVTCALGLATYIFINPHPSSTMFIPILFTSSLGYFFSAGWYPPFVHSRCHIHGKFLHARIFLGRLPASSEVLRRWETCRQSMSSGSNCQPGSCFEHCLCSFTVFPNHGNLAPISEQICEKNKKQPRRFYKQMGRSKVTVINLNNKF